ncbi:hypothetical protein EXIGLDRAFT_695432 [Exidia glandulosa HHB12029]|uniref:Dolichol-phosphate mannosyltransferase subunit 3 n=1 Tax=Exidia glandulosa HHB12029 TaxID=1314781 RepID=A0A165FW83_EXIGL|nr:hypothetical protein EXIGLDRAFT_695432 [Exidia glandulosa HHB12029]
MTRATTFFSAFGILSGIYFAFFNADLPEKFQLIIPVFAPARDFYNSAQHRTVHRYVQLPWWTLVSFGSYALWTLGWAMLSIRECPEAYDELTKFVAFKKRPACIWHSQRELEDLLHIQHFVRQILPELTFHR